VEIYFIIQEKANYLSQLKERLELFEKHYTPKEMNDFQFLVYCEMIQKNLLVIGMDN